MAERRPLVIIDGQVQQLPSGDTLPGGGGGGSIAVEEEGTEVVASVSRINFVGAGVTAVDAGTGEVTVTIPGGTGVDDFLDLTDTPNAYTGHANKLVRVKSDVSGLEFVTPPPSTALSHKTVSGAYSMIDSDFAGHVLITANTSGGNCTLTIPDTLVGTEPVLIQRSGANEVIFAAGGTTTLQSADNQLRLRVNSSVAALIPKGSDVYVLAGDVKT